MNFLKTSCMHRFQVLKPYFRHRERRRKSMCVYEWEREGGKERETERYLPASDSLPTFLRACSTWAWVRLKTITSTSLQVSPVGGKDPIAGSCSQNRAGTQTQALWCGMQGPCQALTGGPNAHPLKFCTNMNIFSLCFSLGLLRSPGISPSGVSCRISGW